MGDKNKSITTKDDAYTVRLHEKQYIWWKTLFDLQRPYRWNLGRLNPGFMLDIGCGIGRNLLHINGNGVGIDHNDASVALARSKGLNTYTPDKFLKSEFNVPGRFDSILLAHVAEHMKEDDVMALLKSYIHLLRPQGRIIIITPQELGYRSDQTHVQFMDFDALRNILHKISLPLIKQYSFPFPRIFGRFFKYNEFICIGQKVD